jgi:predicted N-formylglutamate amidohydrolase
MMPRLPLDSPALQALVPRQLSNPPRLLHCDDPPPFTVVNPNGRAPVVLACDHASNAIPARLNGLGLGTHELSQHIAWDIGAARVARILAARLDAPAVLAGYSRLVIDCNRPPGHPTSIAEVSDGIFIPGNRDLGDLEAEIRLNEVFWPYHHAITQALAHRWRHGHGHAPVLIAIHSFTPVMQGFRRPWHLGVLWNRDPRLAASLLMRFGAHSEWCVGDNQPYSGREVGFTMDTHGGAAGLSHVEVEIRQDLLADDEGCAQWADRMGDVLEIVLQDKILYEVQHY